MKKNKKYKHSFARKLTLWVMLVLLIMMGTLAYFIYYLVKEIVVDYTATTVHISMQLYGKSITDVMSNVSVAVKNNVFDVERDINQPGQLQNIVERIPTYAVAALDSPTHKKGSPSPGEKTAHTWRILH